jgi:hypothetical protein
VKEYGPGTSLKDNKKGAEVAGDMPIIFILGMDLERPEILWDILEDTSLTGILIIFQ